MPLTSDEAVKKSETLADPMCPQSFRVESVLRETHDTFTLNLQPAGNAEMPRFEPGQFSMLYVFGVGEQIGRAHV